MTAPMTAEELQAEIVEQCRLNAMGQEREAKLLAEVKALTATAKDYAAEAVQYRRERDEAKAELTALRAKLVEARQTSLRDVLAYEAGVEDGKQQARECAAERDRALARCEELAKELAEEKARLDYLADNSLCVLDEACDENGVCCEFSIYRPYDEKVFLPAFKTYDYRAAIDAAIAAGKGE